MKFKLDENLGQAVADLLRAAEHDAATVAEEGLQGAPDPRVLDAAHEESRCLITLDMEFANPLIFDPAGFSGIIVIRLRAPAAHGMLLNAIHTVCQAVTSRVVVGKLWIVHRNQIREYDPEI